MYKYELLNWSSLVQRIELKLELKSMDSIELELECELTRNDLSRAKARLNSGLARLVYTPRLK